MDSSRWPPEKQGERPGFPWHALLVSLALHGLLLGVLAPQWTSMTPQTMPAPRMEGRLVATEPSPPSQSSPQLLVAKPESRAEMHSPVFAGASSASTTMGSPQAIPVTTGGEPVQRVSTEPPTTALAPTLVERGGDAAGLRQFRLALAGEARQLRRYPEMARRAGLAGTTEVRVAVEAGGAVRRADLSRSSGHALLDAAALEMLGEALVRTQLPESLRGQNFAVLMPVVFEVED